MARTKATARRNGWYRPFIWPTYDPVIVENAASSCSIPMDAQQVGPLRVRTKKVFENPSVESNHYGSFTLFGKLPLELQTKIWKAAAEEPHIIVIHSRPRSLKWTFFSPTPPPAILHVCSESRRIGLQKYTPRFRNARTYSASPKMTYINFDNDILYFKKNPNRYKCDCREQDMFCYLMGHLKNALWRSEMNNIKNVAVDLEFYSTSPASPYHHHMQHPREISVKNFFLAVEDEKMDCEREVKMSALDEDSTAVFKKKYGKVLRRSHREVYEPRGDNDEVIQEWIREDTRKDWENQGVQRENLNVSLVRLSNY
ncbi:hypothetical protein B0J14DRAFT_303042 [Halenospora varia]|nr:hypothetical protein B0J14DRAFT_303042 [Halenospora varia]